MGIGSMTRGEKAVVYVTRQYFSQSPLMAITEDIEEIHFEVELVHFIQVNTSHFNNLIWPYVLQES